MLAVTGWVLFTGSHQERKALNLIAAAATWTARPVIVAYQGHAAERTISLHHESYSRFGVSRGSYCGGHCPARVLGKASVWLLVSGPPRRWRRNSAAGKGPSHPHRGNHFLKTSASSISSFERADMVESRTTDRSAESGRVDANSNLRGFVLSNCSSSSTSHSPS